jgi:hypothetical protein
MVGLAAVVFSPLPLGIASGGGAGGYVVPVALDELVNAPILHGELIPLVRFVGMHYGWTPQQVSEMTVQQLQLLGARELS